MLSYTELYWVLLNVVIPSYTELYWVLLNVVISSYTELYLVLPSVVIPDYKLVITSSTKFYWLYCTILSTTELVIPNSTELVIPSYTGSRSEKIK